MKCAATRQADIDHISSTGDEVTECNVGNTDINPAPAVADAGNDSHQHQEILKDDENTEEEEDGGGDANVVLGV